MTHNREHLIENILDVVSKDSSRDEEHQLEGDGWSIMKPAYFKKMGFLPELVEQANSRHYSGPGKYGLFDDKNQLVDYIEGVHYGAFLEMCASIVDSTYFCNKNGRGFRAQEALGFLKKAASKETTDGE